MFIENIAGVDSEKTSTLLAEASFFFLTIDGATYAAGDEKESIYLHWSHKGVQQQHFLDFASPESTCYADIHKAITVRL